MAVKIFRINYKSDFILTLKSDAGWMTPFCIKFWTGAPSQAYFVGFDGTTYTHCAPVAGEPTKLRVQFDDHHLPVGNLQFQIAYHFTVADFPNDTEDEVINPASIVIEIDGEQYQVMLDFTGETAPEIEFSLPAYANEAQRIANEEERIAHEQQRIANEEARIAAEQTRQQNEATRQANELQRIRNEEARMAEFARLKADAIAATDAANIAASLANEKAQLASDKAALAQAAATLANEKAQLAADKAALAQAAATLANDKAALAQQKAEYAQQQGGYAKDQGDYAKNQGNYAKQQGDTALADHQRAEADHGIAVDDHTQAGNDHTRAESDHGIAVDDHTQAGNDHTRAEADHGIAVDDHTQAGNDHTRAESDHGIAAEDHTASVAATEAANQAAAGANALQQNLENGNVVPALAGNLESWAEDVSEVSNSWDETIRSTAGDDPIDTAFGGVLTDIVAKSDFKCDALVTSGYNLLRLANNDGVAVAVGNGWYFPVPHLELGAFGDATKNNGVLLTDKDENNINSATVRFKALADGVPTSENDGVVATYQDVTYNDETFRTYLTSGPGYLIVSDITYADTCAHLAWEDWYNKYVSPTDPNDAGDSIDQTALYAAAPNGTGKFLVLGSGGNTVATRATRTSRTQMTITDPIGRVTSPSWTNELQEDEETYKHSLTVSGMKSDGLAQIEGSDQVLTVVGTTVSYTDTNATAISGAVRYEKATPATANVTLTKTQYALNDCGIEMKSGAVGEAYFGCSYSQNVADALSQIAKVKLDISLSVIAEALLYLYNENKALRELLAGKDNAVLPVVKAQNVECDDILTLGVPNVLYSSVAGAPSAANIPDNWDEATMDVWIGCPRKIGQQYVDRVSKKVYYAVAVTGSTSDWVVLN